MWHGGAVAAGNEPELLVGGHRDINQLRARQIEIAHHRDEFVARAPGHAAVGGALAADGRFGAALVVMRGIDARVIGEAKQLLRQAVEQRAGIARLEIGPSAACLLYTSPSPRDQRGSRMPSSA